jgi:alcohol dehydrogenase (cytochrome c)
MTVEYVDAGEAIDQGLLNFKTPGGDVAPPVVRTSTTSAFSTHARSPQNWLTYYGAYDGQRYSPLDQINTRTSSASSRRGSSRPARPA